MFVSLFSNILRMKGQIVIFLSLCALSSAILSNFNGNLFHHNENPNPDEELNTLQMIRKAGYPAEAHVTLTEDGYLLTMHRIPGKPGSPAIFLQHGLLGSSADWVVSGKGKSLAYLLADRDYDVWLGNFRGNTYSRAHVSFSHKDLKFWDFSWHESGIYDLPAMITYIVKLKENFLRAYIGFSMGTTCFYVMASERPQIARLLQSTYSLAPVVFMKHVKSPLRYIAPLAYDKIIFSLLGEGELLPQNKVLKFLSKYLCTFESWEEKICANSLFVLTGFDKAQFNYTLLPVILNHAPAGTSSKTVVHYGQGIESGEFKQYDYGAKRNMEIYKSTEPPKYNISKITMPITLFCGDNDWLSSPVDVMRLSNELPRKPIIYKVPFAKFNHIDFLWATDVVELVYKKLLDMLS